MRIKKENTYDFTSFGNAVKKAREKSRLTREETACKINISPRHLAAIETEGRSPSAHILLELAKYFQISIDQYIFDDVINKTEKLQLIFLIEQLTQKEKNICETLIQSIIENRE